MSSRSSRGKERAGRGRWSDLRAFRLPLGMYLASRLVVLAGALLVGVLRGLPGPALPASSTLTSWDGGWYREIVLNGYPDHVPRIDGRATQSALAFFPIYPLTVRAADEILNMRLSRTFVLVSHLIGAVAVWLLWKTTRRLFDEETATHAAIVFCFFPGAVILSYAYSEGLMLCFSMACLAALHQRRWVLGGLMGALATATRPNAIVLTASAAWAAWAAIRGQRDWRALAALVLTPLGTVAYLGYVAVHTGQTDAWFEVQRDGWGQRFDGGWTAMQDTLKFLASGPGDVDDAIAFIGILVVGAGLVMLWRSRMPAVYTVYALGILAMTLGSENLGPRPRFVLTAFPLIIAAAAQLRRESQWMVAAAGAAAMMFLVVWYGLAPSGSVPP